MRVVVSAPKSGNHWIKCLLGRIYDLVWLDGDETPNPTPEAYRAWFHQGGFPAGSIFHQRVRFSRALVAAFDEIPAHLVTIDRAPYVVFVSLYYWAQERAAHNVTERKARPREAMTSTPLNHPDVLTFLAEDFGSNPARASGWLHFRRAVVIRNEGLHRDPATELTRATDRIGRVDRARIEAAVKDCRADKMRQMNDKLAWRVRSAKVGDSRERLGEPHLAVFRDRYADLFRSLGYEVRQQE